MPDLPQQGGAAPVPPQGGPPPGAPPSGGGAPGGDPSQSGGGGIAEAIAMVDSTINKIAQAVAQNPKVSGPTKDAWTTALAAVRKAEQALVDEAGGGDGKSEPDEDDAGGATTPEQGGNKGAVPISHQSMRGQ